MEEIIQNKEIIGVLIVVIASAITSLNKIVSLFLELVRKSLLTRFTNSEKLKNIQFDLQVKKQNQLHEDELKQLTKDAIFKNGRGLLSSVLKVTKILDELLHTYNLCYVTIDIFHNGTSNGFKNFSRRYERVSDRNKSFIDQHQSKPLSPFYETLNKFKELDYVEFDLENTKYPMYNTVIYENITKVVKFPLLVPITDSTIDKPIIITKFKNDYVLLGTVSIKLDKKSKFMGDKEFKSILYSVDDMLNMYEENDKIFG